MTMLWQVAFAGEVYGIDSNRAWLRLSDQVVSFEMARQTTSNDFPRRSISGSQASMVIPF